jgi:hypothetical protein
MTRLPDAPVTSGEVDDAATIAGLDIVAELGRGE